MWPPRSILVGVDFSPSSRVALVLASRLARRCGAALHVVHAGHPLVVAAAADVGVDLTHDAHAELSRFIDETPGAAACQPHRHVVIGASADVVLTIAAREGADLIVLGARGHAEPGRLLLGSVTQHALQEADRSVLIVPDSWHPPENIDDIGLGPVVVGVDHSEHAVVASRAASALAVTLQTTVDAVHVVPALSVIERWKPHAERVMAERAASAGRELKQLLSPVTSSATAIRIERGDIAEQLLLAAAPTGGHQPLLVVGRRCGVGPEGGPGATALRIATLARVPVLMHADL